MGGTTGILGYTDGISVAPGESIAFKVSCAGVPAYRAEIVRLICADPDPSGPGVRYDVVERDIGPLPGRPQRIRPGSYILVEGMPDLDPHRGMSVAAFVWPTLAGRGEQTILAQWSERERRGYALSIGADGSATMRLGDGSGGAVTVATGVPLAERTWSFVAAAFDARSGSVRLWQACLREYPGVTSSASARAGVRLGSGWADGAPLTIAAHILSSGEGGVVAGGHFNGKIDSPRLLGAAAGFEELDALARAKSPQDERLVAAWDFSRSLSGTRVEDISGRGLDGETVNLPMRGATGHDWDGRALDWRLAPDRYGAIHFHEDDLYDCGWDSDFEWHVPDGARSGFHAARLLADDVESWISFFVRPPRDRAAAPVALVASTATYMAYANTHIKFDSLNSETLFESVLPLAETELHLNEHRELGYSHYDTHADGSGVVYSSRLRPILNMRPGLYTFNYVNDTHVTAWLDARGQAYDVITDEDVHQEGVGLLSRYRVVITPSHPEYVSTAMWDAFDAYQRGGGRHMCLGGNGFYWRIAFHPDLPGVIEARRGFTGVRTWESEPGEEVLSFSGEPGGLWRTHGRAPQALVGVGFSSTVFARSAWYRRTDRSRDALVSFIFEGIGEDEKIGDFGGRGGGAAGLEIDRADPVLGTPPNALVVATSEGIGYGGLLSMEEFITTTRAVDGEQNARVRADMVFFDTPGGGAVFSTGSIAWATSLAHNGFDNNVSRITGNVLRRFLDPTPFR